MKAIGLIFAFLAACATAVPAFASLQVDVTKGNIQPVPVAIPDFAAASSSDAAAGQNIAQVIRADLDRSGLFQSLDPKSFVDKVTDINGTPQFADWRIINAQGLVTGAVALQSDGRLRVDFRLWDVYGGSQMQGERYFTEPANWRRIAHMISDEIYKAVTGEDGYFNTRIVFIAESGPPLARKHTLAIMDEDGANPSFLTSGNYLVLSPRFNPTKSEQMIAYLSYAGKKPAVYLCDLESGKQDRLGDFTNMTFAPSFSPDGNKIAMSLEENGNTDVYVMDLRTRGVTRLTYDPAIDTSPSFSPDGKQIVFESDRGGSQQVYVMNADGSNQHRISFGAGHNGTPVWSPRGDLIAFTKVEDAAIRIGVMHPDGSGERMLSTGWEDEGPTWAPNGMALMFTRTLQNGRGAQIWSIDVTGRNERRVAKDIGDASDPAWSPLIQ
jgi:TolB protein